MKPDASTPTAIVLEPSIRIARPYDLHSPFTIHHSPFTIHHSPFTIHHSAPPIIGLTGTVGAGKSTVATLLRDLGCVVSDSDALAREAFEDPAVVMALRARWGQRALDADGRPDRRAIAAIVFGDSAERSWLESVVHPWIESRRDAQFAAAPPDTPALVIDAPLLLETGLDRRCHGVWVVDAPVETRLGRVSAARGWDAAELARREASQWPPDRKRASATVLIENGGSRAELAAMVTRALARALSRARARMEKPA